MSDFAADISTIAHIAAVPTILDVVCRTTGMGFAAVARVTEDRWVACGVRDEIGFGLQPGGELKVETTICNEIRDNRQAVIIDHVAEDPAFARHHTPAMYGFQSYISMPIILPDGAFFGTLCAIDPKPRRLKTPEVTGMFKLFADLIAFHIDAHRRLESSAADLQNAQQTADLRDQFIAVLGHDLRNPLAAISAGARLLKRAELDDTAQTVLGHVEKSVGRMAGIIDDVLDLARGRLGAGLVLAAPETVPVAPLVEQIVSEWRATDPDRVIDSIVEPGLAIEGDASRLGQLLSNLMSNALTHGAPEGAVHIRAIIQNNMFDLSVANAGDAIPPAIQQDLFKPFFRGSKPEHAGLGLGLYISAQIARAHGGTLTVASNAQETRFTFRMPLK